MLRSAIRFSSSRVAVALAGIGITAMIVITPFLVAIIVAATSSIPSSVAEPATVAMDATKSGDERPGQNH